MWKAGKVPPHLCRATHLGRPRVRAPHAAALAAAAVMARAGVEIGWCPRWRGYLCGRREWLMLLVVCTGAGVAGAGERWREKVEA